MGVFVSYNGGELGMGPSAKGVSDWRELDMLKLNEPIREAKSLEVKACPIKAPLLNLTSNSVWLLVC